MKKFVGWLIVSLGYFIIGIVMGSYGISAWNAFTLLFWILIIQWIIDIIIDVFNIEF